MIVTTPANDTPGLLRLGFAKSANSPYFCIVHQESPLRAANRACQTPRWQNDADVQSKKVCIMDNYNYFKQGGVRPTAEQLLDTKLFYQHSAEIYARFDEWKDNDKFYFIPLFMQMTYSCAGWVAEIAPDPVWLGSFMRCTLEHPDLFQYKCPNCGKTVLAHRYCGSPLSGRVDLEGRCECGWKGFDCTTGWRIRATALRDTIQEDSNRFKRFNWRFNANVTTTKALVEWLLDTRE